MLINLRDICALAEERTIALAAFNTPSLEAARAALDAAEELDVPVIIQHAACHEEFAPLEVLGPTLVALAERSQAQVCVHLDHCESLSYLHRALEMGFSGAMYDGSALPYDRNVALSRAAADMCAPYNCGLECELGTLGPREQGLSTDETTAQAIYTDPDLAADFVTQTGLDALACSFGTVHGLYKGEPCLSFETLEEITERVAVPLVMHGGSGVSDADYVRAIDKGIRKINYYTYGVKYAADAVGEMVQHATTSEQVLYWHDMTTCAYERMRKDFRRVMATFARIEVTE